MAEDPSGEGEGDGPPPAAAWNLGRYAAVDGVRYFKSDLGPKWVEQIVPRKKVNPGGPEADRYFLTADGQRFRSMTQVRKYLDATAAQADGGGEGDVEEEDSDNDGSDGDDVDEKEEEDQEGEETEEEAEEEKEVVAGEAKEAQEGVGVEEDEEEEEEEDEEDKQEQEEEEEEGGQEEETQGDRCHDSNGDESTAEADQPRIGRRRRQRRYYKEAAESMSTVGFGGGRDDEEDEGDDGAQASKTELKSSFAEALHDMVSFLDATDPSVVSWMPDGEAFKVHDTSKETLGPSLEKYFRHNNYSSLARQLNNYGFTMHLAGRFAGAFHHPGFRRDMKSKTDFSSVCWVDSATKESKTYTRSSRRRSKRKHLTSSPLATDVQDGNPNLSESAAQYHHDVEKGSKKAKTNHIYESQESKRGRRFQKDVTVEYSIPNHKSGAAADQQNLSYHCFKCSKDFVFHSRKTAAASFGNHLRKCDPERFEAMKVQNSSPKKTIRAQGQKKRARSSASPSRKVRASADYSPKETDLTAVKAPTSKLAPTPTEGGVEEQKKPAPDIPDQPAIAVVAEQTTSNLIPVQTGAIEQPSEGDIILSLANPWYKQIMFANYQKLGIRKGGEENESLVKVRDDLFLFFKKALGKDGRFLKSDRRMNNIQQMNNDDAMEKIKMDLRRRNESLKHWSRE